MALLQSICLFLLGLGLMSGVSRASQSEWVKSGWELLNEQDGIKSYRKSFADSPVKGVGGEAMIEASIGKILWVLMDHEHKIDWVDKFQSASTVQEVSPLVHIQYASFNMPFPVTDRDFVYRYEFIANPTKNAVVVTIKSVKHPKTPESQSVGVRGEILSGQYVLYPKGPNRTFVTVEYLADPKGSLPAWVVNLVQKQWPYKTLGGLRQQVKKPFVKEWDVYGTQLQPKLKLLSH